MAREVTVGQVAAAAAEACTLRELGERVLPRVQALARASATLLYRYDDTGRLVPLAGGIGELIDHYDRHYLRHDPVHAHPRTLAPRPRVVLATRTVDRASYRRSAAYGEFYRAFELEHLACVWLTDVPYGAPGMTGLLLARGRGRGAGEYDAADERALGAVLPMLAAVTRRAARLESLEVERGALEAIATASGGAARLVMSATGSVLWASRAIGEVLPAIPDALRDAARRLADRARVRAGAPVAVALARGVVAELALLRGPGGEPLVVVELAGEHHRVELLARRLGLTRAEAAVLNELAAGRRNADIGAELGIATETVRTHVRRVLAKLGVASRVQAALIAARVA